MRRYVLAVTGLMAGLCLLLAIGTATVTASTFTVNSTDDTDDGKCNVAHCSLREAINGANANSGGDTIEFDIPKTDSGYSVGVSGTWTISLTSALPNITDHETTIDGDSQALNQGDTNPDGPEIEITGASLGTGSCLSVNSDQNKIRGLVINRCPWHGIYIFAGGDANVISGNYIGTDATGSVDLGNGWDGVHITGGSQDNLVGGDTPGERNVISGNDQYGANIYGSGTTSNTISGNYIGTDATGTVDLGNSWVGVFIGGGSHDNVIGGDTAAERNVISGNDQRGVYITHSGTTSNTISGNYIGTDATGTVDLGNSWNGVFIASGSHGNLIGGDTAAERNVISGNDWDGVLVSGSGTTSNTISGNYIGTDATGTVDLGNGSAGVCIASGSQDNLVGGDTTAERNVISGNNQRGVVIEGSGTMSNTISGNYIGTDATGSVDLGNGWEGVWIDSGAQANVIGGDTPGERNIISGNGDHGVAITGSGAMSNTVSGNYIGTDASGALDLGNSVEGVWIASGAQANVIGGETVGESNVIAFNDTGVRVHGATTTGNTIIENSIHSNGGLGIDLVNGGNTELTAPTIALADCLSLYFGTAPGNATVELFTGPDEEGKTYLTTVSADGGGNWSLWDSFTLDTYVTATATDGAGNTSEFSTQVSPGPCHQIFAPLVMKVY
jgi:titin